MYYKMTICPVCGPQTEEEKESMGTAEINFRRCHAHDNPPTLSATISVKPAQEDNIKGMDVTCGDTTFIPVEVEDDDR